MDSKYKVGDGDITDISKTIADSVEHSTRASINSLYSREMDKLFRENIYCGHDDAKYREIVIPRVYNEGRRFHRECPICGPKGVRLTVNFKAGY